MNYLTIRKHLLLLSILLELSFPVSSQKKSELTLGIALPEMLNAGFKYGTDFQVGGAVGFMPVINFLTLTGGIFYNFRVVSLRTDISLSVHETQCKKFCKLDFIF
jgi:hypothetical protein